jgi:hypothetical protein
MGVHLMGVHLMSMHLMDVHLMNVPLSWASLTGLFRAEPFGGTITHHHILPNTVVCGPMAWRLKIGARSTVRKSQVYIRLCQTIGIV